MSKIHINGYGSTLEVSYSVVKKSDIKSKDDLYKAYIDSLVDWNENRETYFSTPEYQNEDFEEITVKEKMIKSSYSELPDPKKDEIAISVYAISKKGYVEFDIDDTLPVELTCLEFDGTNWIENIQQNGEEIYFDITDSGMPNEEHLYVYFVNKKGETDSLSGNWYSLEESFEIDEELENEIREITDEWYESIFK